MILLLTTARVFREFTEGEESICTMFCNCTIAALANFTQICNEQKFNASTKTFLFSWWKTESVLVIQLLIKT